MTSRIPEWHRWLRDRGIWLKILFLALVIVMLLPIGVSAETLQGHAIRVVVSVPILCIMCFLLAGRVFFKAMFNSWLIGAIPYLAIAIPLTLTGVRLTPYITLHDPLDRWLYTALFPPRILGIFAAGTILMAILSPTNFLRFGSIGIKMAVILRAYEYAVQQVASGTEALRLQGNWVGEQARLLNVQTAKRVLKGCIKLVIMCFRNAILWSPWAYLSFNAMQRQLARKL